MGRSKLSKAKHRAKHREKKRQEKRQERDSAASVSTTMSEETPSDVVEGENVVLAPLSQPPSPARSLLLQPETEIGGQEQAAAPSPPSPPPTPATPAAPPQLRVPGPPLPPPPPPASPQKEGRIFDVSGLPPSANLNFRPRRPMPKSRLPVAEKPELPEEDKVNVEDLKTELQRRDKDITKLQNEKDSLQAQIDTAETAWSAELTEKRNFETRLQALTKFSDDQQAQYASEMSIKNDQIKSLRANFEKFSKERKDEKAQLNDLKTTASQTRLNLDASKEEVKRLNARLTQQLTKVEENTQLIDDLQDSLQTTQSLLSDSDDVRSKMEQGQEDLNKQIDEINASVAETDKHHAQVVEDLRAQINRLTALIPSSDSPLFHSGGRSLAEELDRAQPNDVVEDAQSSPGVRSETSRYSDSEASTEIETPTDIETLTEIEIPTDVETPTDIETSTENETLTDIETPTETVVSSAGTQTENDTAVTAETQIRNVTSDTTGTQTENVIPNTAETQIRNVTSVTTGTQTENVTPIAAETQTESDTSSAETQTENHASNAGTQTERHKSDAETQTENLTSSAGTQTETHTATAGTQTDSHTADAGTQAAIPSPDFTISLPGFGRFLPENYRNLRIPWPFLLALLFGLIFLIQDYIDLNRSRYDFFATNAHIISVRTFTPQNGYRVHSRYGFDSDYNIFSRISFGVIPYIWGITIGRIWPNLLLNLQYSFEQFLEIDRTRYVMG